MLPAALWPRAIAISVVLCVSVLWLDADYLGLCAAFLTTGSFALQVLQILKTRETKAISNSMYLAFSCGVLCWLVYGLQIGDIPLIIANAITLALACTGAFSGAGRRQRAVTSLMPCSRNSLGK